MALSGLTKGKVALGEEPPHPADAIGTIEGFYAGKIAPEEIARIRAECAAKNVPLHDALMDAAGWPAVALDGKLLVTHQDALLMGGKVQAPPGYADHVTFLQPERCRTCGKRVCVEICSAEAIRPGDEGTPTFDREKCVHCGACLWSCTERVDGTDRVNLQFRAGTGGLHSAEN
jgi:electron-transferring-flavoprotein dehydrogenase